MEKYLGIFPRFPLQVKNTDVTFNTQKEGPLRLLLKLVQL